MREHLFKPGVSGNPKGKPKDKTPATLLRKSIAEAMPDIILTLIEQAKAGDVAAAKCLLDRVCPTLKPQAMPICLPVNGSLVEQGGEVIRATLAGQIPPDIGSQLITALSNQGKLVELEELTERLQRIEKQLEARE
ncbi:MAG: DUF5681 domain-containing protein [Methylobacter sp.]|uniref:DUF5681 domain-containing protein n=1 Tax=Methylobacter sp. TaxID=2051955 RepID=UPI00272FBD52|nr:DUF5681 domain-containing protein [Methylobacter sp.]MDP1667091.1 DUF5681 domain-containing protein [Methylobacter sp.]